MNSAISRLALLINYPKPQNESRNRLYLKQTRLALTPLLSRLNLRVEGRHSWCNGHFLLPFYPVKRRYVLVMHQKQWSYGACICFAITGVECLIESVAKAAQTRSQGALRCCGQIQTALTNKGKMNHIPRTSSKSLKNYAKNHNTEALKASLMFATLAAPRLPTATLKKSKSRKQKSCVASTALITRLRRLMAAVATFRANAFATICQPCIKAPIFRRPTGSRTSHC